MHLWELLGIIGIAFVIFEMFVPSMFFLNFALAAFFTAVVSVFVKNSFALVLVFFVLSFVSFLFLRPILVQKFCKDKETGVEDKYIGKIVMADTDITENSGVISMYGERWDARCEAGKSIPQGTKVKIIRNESLIMYVDIA